MPVAASSTRAPLNINSFVGRSPAGMAALHFPRDLIWPNVRMREAAREACAAIVITG